MTTTVRLLSTHNGNPPQTIVRLPDATAAAFVAAGNASLDLTGGINKAPPVVSRLVGGAARLLYNAAGTFLGLGDAQGNLLLSASGTTSTNLTAPGAPTSFTLTAAAGAVMGAFTAPASDGGESIDWYEMTLSNGTVVRGDASPLYASAPVGVSVSATVRAVNDVGMSPASNSASATPTGTAPGDTTPPTANAAAVANSTPTVVAITMSEALAATLPAASAFTVSGHTVTGVAISGSVVSLTVTAAFVNGEAARTVSYTKPGTNPIADAAGNQLATFSALAITNNVAAAGDTTPPTANSAAVANSAPTQLVITMSEAMGATLPAASAFAVGGHTVSAVAISGSTITLTVDAFVNGEAARTVAYTKPGTNPAVDAAGNQLASFSGQAVTNNVQASGSTPLVVESRGVAVGDSMTNLGSAPTWLFDLIQKLGGRLYLPTGYNQAVSGKTVNDVLTAQLTPALALSPDILFDMSGTNSLGLTAATVDAIMTDKTSIVTQALNSGVKHYFLATVPPRNDAVWNSLTQTRRDDRAILNARYATLAATDARIHLVSMEGYNPATMSSDGLHQNWIGEDFLATQLANAVVAVFTTQTLAQAVAAAGSVNLLTNPTFSGTTGTSSGNPAVVGPVPTGWVAETSGTGIQMTLSQPAAGSLAIAFSGTADAATRVAQVRSSTVLSGAIGDAYEAWVSYTLSSPVNLRSVFMRVGSSGTGVTPANSTSEVFPTSDRTGLLRCPALKLTAAVTSLGITIGVAPGGTSAIGGTITLSEPFFRKVVGANATNP